MWFPGEKKHFIVTGLGNYLFHSYQKHKDRLKCFSHSMAVEVQLKREDVVVRKADGSGGTTQHSDQSSTSQLFPVLF